MVSLLSSSSLLLVFLDFNFCISCLLFCSLFSILLLLISGVYTTTIDGEQTKVTVSGNVDPTTLIKKLAKAGNHAKLLAPNGGHNDNNKGNQFKTPQIENWEGQQDNRKLPKGGDGGKEQKGQPSTLPPHQLKQLQFHDLKLRT